MRDASLSSSTQWNCCSSISFSGCLVRMRWSAKCNRDKQPKLSAQMGHKTHETAAMIRTWQRHPDWRLAKTCRCSQKACKQGAWTMGETGARGPEDLRTFYPLQNWAVLDQQCAGTYEWHLAFLDAGMTANEKVLLHAIMRISRRSAKHISDCLQGRGWLSGSPAVR